MKLSIVIPVFNNWAYTCSCLKDLSKTDCEIIVVDNASSDDTKTGMKKFPRVKYIRNDKNLGFGKACNIGYAASSGQYVMFLNNDIKVVGDYDTWYNKCCIDGVIAGPTLGKLDRSFVFAGEYDRAIGSGYIYMSGWNITASREVWEKMGEGFPGPWNETYMAYWEDTHMGLLAKERGVPLQVVPNLPVKHYGRKTGALLDLSQVFRDSRGKFLNIWEKRATGLWQD